MLAGSKILYILVDQCSKSELASLEKSIYYLLLMIVVEAKHFTYSEKEMVKNHEQ